MHEQVSSQSNDLPLVNVDGQSLHYRPFSERMTLGTIRGILQHNLMLLESQGDESKGMKWLVECALYFAQELPMAGEPDEEKTKEFIQKWNHANTDGEREKLLVDVQDRINTAYKKEHGVSRFVEHAGTA